MHDFTPWRSLFGGALIGLAASLLWAGTGRVAGISGIFGDTLLGRGGDSGWRWLFLLGLMAGGLLFERVLPGSIAPSPRPLLLLAASGVLVGVGTRLGGGCTSGHGVCGVSRMSPRSLVATLTFIATGALSVAVLHGTGAAP
jgi:uncharacterized protein